MELDEYKHAFDQVESDFEASVEQFGLGFEDEESQPRTLRLACAKRCGCHCENGDSSLWQGWISPACLACRTGVRTATFFVDLRCTKNCYFCFNPNQEYYDYFLSHSRDIVAELESAYAAGEQFDCLAITGGEPMLHKVQVLRFISRAHELYPGAHIRLYTSGDSLDALGLKELKNAGLNEIRFSVKPDNLAEIRDFSSAEALMFASSIAVGNGIFSLIAQAVDVIPSVMIEIPVIPGSFPEMLNLLRIANAVGVQGVNLLEFCFPLCNAEEFAKRGFELRKHPYSYLYDYWYGGGVPVAGSEAECLKLLEAAHSEGVTLGIHYCSSDNKNTGQLYQQNKAFLEDEALQQKYPYLTFDHEDKLIKCIKAFGDDVAKVKAWMQQQDIAYFEDSSIPSISIPVDFLEAAHASCQTVAFVESANVFEPREDGFYLRELGVCRIEL